jgi:hypothetical protein
LDDKVVLGCAEKGCLKLSSPKALEAEGLIKMKTLFPDFSKHL